MPQPVFQPFPRFAALFSGRTLFAFFSVPLIALSAPAQANWVDISLDTNSSYAIAAQSEKAVPGLFNESETAKLVVRCSQNNTSISFTFEHTYLSDVGDYANVSLQLDEGVETIVALTRGETSQTLVWPDGRRAVPFLIEALRASTLHVRLTSLTDETLTADFPLGGISTAIMPIRSACNW